MAQVTIYGKHLTEAEIEALKDLVAEAACSDGEIVVALVRGEEATLKYLFREQGKVRLDPANAAYDPQFYGPGEVEVQGKLAGLLRRYH